MCGIIGYIGGRNTLPILFDGLQRLEYRGYDSAGVALIRKGKLEVHKKAGKVADLVVWDASHPDELAAQFGAARPLRVFRAGQERR